MRVKVTSLLSCSPEAAWGEVLKPSHLVHVAYPMAVIKPAVPPLFPVTWQDKQTYICSCYLFVAVPIGRRTLFFERIDPERRSIQTREFDPLVKKWDHLMTVVSAPDGKTLYTDDIELDAGWLTPVVWLWASLFYLHRHRRWRAKAARLVLA